MNFKINLWTLLFGLAVGALIWMHYNTDDVKPDVKPDDSKIKLPRNNEISEEDFKERYGSYEDRYFPVIDDDTLNLKDRVGVDTMGIRYYILAANLLDSMYDYYKEIDSASKVYVYPVIKFDERLGVTEGIDSLDLVFKITDSKGDSTRYYDFTRPCPPVCGKDDTGNYY